MAYKFQNTPGTIGLSNKWHFTTTDDPVPGDLVILKHVLQSEWYLSWYIERMPVNATALQEHMLESVETEKLCKWSDVGFAVLNREVVDDHPEWKWTDAQWEFHDLWRSTCIKKRKAYFNLPCAPVFEDSTDKVTLTLRKRFDAGVPTSQTFDNWKQLKVRDMLEFYDAVVDN